MSDDDDFMRLPAGKRIDLVLAVLGAMPVQEAGGWTLDALADLAVVSRQAVGQREQRALRKVRKLARHLEEDWNGGVSVKLRTRHRVSHITAAPHAMG